MKNTNSKKILSTLLVIITTLLVGGSIYWMQTNKVTVETTTITQGYSSDSPLWTSFTSDIKTKTGEDITSFYAPESSSNNNVIYISTSGDISGEWPNMKMTNKIYSYNVKTGELLELYKEHKNRVLRTMGIEGSKLIVMYDLIDNSPGPCFSIWSDWKEFGYLDVKNPDTLKSYNVPDYQVQKGIDEQKECSIIN